MNHLVKRYGVAIYESQVMGVSLNNAEVFVDVGAYCHLALLSETGIFWSCLSQLKMS